MTAAPDNSAEPSPHPDIAVVVSTYRRPVGLRRLLDALVKQTLAPQRWEVIVVDNCSGPPYAEQLRAVVEESPLPVRLLRTEVNRGPAAARNLGWQSSTAEVVAFTDDDCEPRPGWLEAGLAEVSAADRVGVVQGRTVRASGTEDYPYTCFTVVREVLAPSPWFEGCNLFVRRPALEAVGGFDVDFGYFGEETSLGWSVLEAGWERGWAADAVVEHEVTDRPWSWHLRVHLLERNIVRLAARHPQMRSMFWRPWAVKRENALFALAVGGMVAGTRYRPALVLAAPYLVWLFPPGQRPMGPQAAAQQISAHGASFAGKVMAALKERTLVL